MKQTIQITPYQVRYQLRTGANDEWETYFSCFDTLDGLLDFVSELYAFNDCCDSDVRIIKADGHYLQYVGWQPGMLYEYKDCTTGKIVYSRSFPNWDH